MRRKIFSEKLVKRGLSIVAALAMTISMLPAVPLSAEAAENDELLKAGSIPVSEETITQEEPFAPGTGGSQYFRIPALITLNNGDLLATADARWETSGDGGGLDTIASVSSDNGKTWNYSFPIYFPDSQGYAGTNATTIIDPGILEGPDGTIYCFVDVNPTGITTLYGTVGTGTGFVDVDGVQRLAITSSWSNASTMPTDSDTTTYEYYVSDFDENGFAPILKRSDDSASGYGVDEWYNLYSVKDGEYVADLTQTQVNNSSVTIQQNVYYRDSLFHVYNIGYIWMVTSNDHGRTWNAPKILNPQIKRTPNEHALLVSPGQGIVTSTGDLIMPFYDSQDGQENSSFIYSSDGGETWKRTNDVQGMWSSESEMVELEDGTLRMFYRNGTGAVCYADATKSNGEYTMGTGQNTGVSVTSTCNVTAISYSKKINGKQAILVACPGGSGRTNGKVFTFLVEEDNSMTLLSTFSVPDTSSGYCYSCMTELDDGTIGLLWEPSHQAILYDNYDIYTLSPSALVNGGEQKVEMYVGESFSKTYSVDGMTGEVTEEPDSDIAELSVVSTTETVYGLCDHIAENASDISDFATEANSGISLSEAEFTLTAADGGGYTVYNEAKGKYFGNDTYAADIFKSSAVATTFYPVENADGTTSFRIANGTSYDTSARHLIFFYTKMNFNANGSYTENYTSGSHEFVLLEKQDSASASDLIPGYARASQITSGKKYLITHIWNDGSILVLYPASGVNAMTKKVASPVTMTSTTIEIAGVGIGETTAVVDGAVYKINIKDNRLPLDLEVGDVWTVDLEDVNYTVTPEDTDVVEVKAGKENRMQLYDHGDTVASSLSSFSETANSKITVEEAEMTITAVDGGGYYLYNEAKKAYYANNGTADTMFKSAAAATTLYPVENADGTTSFRIANGASYDTSARHMIFYYPQMNFNANSAYTANYTNGSHEFVLLEKQDSVSSSDVIPGYARASQITSGKKYLITHIWNDGSVIVMYPTNGQSAMTKLYGEAEVDVLSVEAKAEGTAEISVNGKIYKVTVIDPVKEQEREEAAKAKAEAKAELAKAAAEAETVYKAGASTYTEDSWKAFAEAYAAAVNAAEDIDTDALKVLTENLKSAFAALKKAEVIDTPGGDDPVVTLKTGDTAVVNKLKYRVINVEKKQVAVTGAQSKKLTKVTVPATVKINGETCTVTEISANAFAKMSKLKTVVIGKNVQKIGKKAFFQDKKLKKVTVKSKKLTKVAKNAFKGTKLLKAVKVPKSSKKAYTRLFKKAGKKVK